jgi:HEAT repeats
MHSPQRPLRRLATTAFLAAVAPTLGCGSKSSDDGPHPIDVGRADLEAVNVGVYRVKPPTNGNATEDDGVDIEFDVDATVLSTVIVAAPEGGNVTVLATELRAPGGELLLDLDTSSTDAILPSLYQARVRAYPFLGPGPFALLFPGTTDQATAGTYRAHYNVFGRDPQNVRFFTVQKKSLVGAAAPTSGQLPVTIWFAENSYLDADDVKANEPSAQSFLAAFDEFERIYANAGITVGTPTFRNLPAAPARRFSVVDADEFGDLFSSVDTSETPGLNFFLVESLEIGASGGVAVGLANGIPGPPALPGMPGGGVAVSLITLDVAPKLVGQVMAHEGGHYLGLMHTSERDGTLFDLLADTPECDADKFDLDRNRSVEVEECGLEGGANNLMFWSADATPEKVTPNQSSVLLRNPMVDTSRAVGATNTTSSPNASHGSNGAKPPFAALDAAAPALAPGLAPTPPSGGQGLRTRLARAFSGYETSPDKTALERLASADQLVPALIELATDPSESPHKRANAIASLRFFADVGAARAELFARASDASALPMVRRSAVRALVSAYGDEALSAVAPLLAQADADLRQTAVKALGAAGSPRARELLERHAAVEGDANVKLALRRALPLHSR